MRFDPNAPPPDPAKYVLVDSKEGKYWRVRRGLGEKPATINRVLAREVSLTKQSAPAAALLRQTLQPWLAYMDCGRITMRLSARIREGLKKGSWPDYSLLSDFKFQPDYPIRKLLKSAVQFQQVEETLQVRIAIPADGALVARNKLVTHYRFVLVLLSGDPVEDRALPVVETQSEDYPFIKAAPDCLLTLAVPEDGRPWLLLLRVVCFEGKEFADSAGNAAMKVVGWG